MEKEILVLARRDTNEAMRVAAGLTIFGHSVMLVLLSVEFDQSAYEETFAELLDLADIEPVTTISAKIGQFKTIDEDTFAEEVIKSEAVISL